MTIAEMHALVAEELSHIPDWPKGPQSHLRSYYQVSRLHSLGRKAEKPGQTKADVLAVAIKATKQEDPAFLPLYDAEYFGELPEVG